jgi:hypothetical protein
MLRGSASAPSVAVNISRFQETIAISLEKTWPVKGCVLQLARVPAGQLLPSTEMS